MKLKRGYLIDLLNAIEPEPTPLPPGDYDMSVLDDIKRRKERRLNVELALTALQENLEELESGQAVYR